MSLLDRKKFAIIEKIYGHDIENARKLIESYGEAIEEITDLGVKNYLISLKMILEENDMKKIESLEQIEGIDNLIIDNILIEDKIKKEFGQIYDEQLYRVTPESTKYQGKEFGKANNVYEANPYGKYNIIGHVIAGCSANKKEIENYYDYWNRENVGDFMSCSYFTEKTTKRAGGNSVRNICFGFVGMENELLRMGDGDIGTYSQNGIVTSNINKFLSPVKMKEYTVKNDNFHSNGWNEMVYSPWLIRKDNKGNTIKYKKQPDYIVAYKMNDKIIDDISAILQAQKDFREHGIELPIVVVDLSKVQTIKDDPTVTMSEYRKNYEEMQEQVEERGDISKQIKEHIKKALDCLENTKGEKEDDER